MTIGDINASKITGPLRIDSNTKDIELTDVTGSTVLDVQRGDIRVECHHRSGAWTSACD